MRRLPDAGVVLSIGLIGHLACVALRQRGQSWIADVDPEDLISRRLSWDSSVKRRLILTADALTCRNSDAQKTLALALGASVTVASSQAPVAFVRLLAGLTHETTEDGLRILMLGPVNSPHLEHLALAIQRRGHAVRAGGAIWSGLGDARLPALGVPVSTVTWPQAVWVRRVVRRFRPDVVHANWLPFAADAALAGVRPLVASAWGSDVYLADRLHDLANRFTVRRADLLLADSGPLAARLVELGARPERVSVINWGVDTSMFRPAASVSERAELRRSLGLDDGPVIISPRGAAALYNPEVVLDAFRRVLNAVPDAQLIFKHQSDFPPDISSLITTPRVHVVGRVDYDDLPNYFRAADVCISIAQTDSSPRSVWEAMSAGCACVLSDLPWVHDLIENEVHAVVVPTAAQAVADAVTRLLVTPQLRADIVKNGRNLVREHRDTTREMDRLVKLYRSVLWRSDAVTSSRTDASSPVSASRE